MKMWCRLYLFTKNNQRPKFRNGPWPYTGSRRGGSGLRAKRCHGALKGWSSFEYEMKEYDLSVYKVCRVREIHTLWDDDYKFRYRSWKEYRKTQYKGVVK